MNPGDIRILVVDDEPSILHLARRILEGAGYQVQTASSGEAALEAITSASPRLVITDLKMPGMSGIELMRKVRAQRPEIDFILFTAFATVENAVEAMKEGAIDYLVKPLKDPEELKISVERVLERQALLRANTLWTDRLAEDLPPNDVIFAGMPGVFEEISQVARTEATVLLLGESGTGKSLIAKVIHHASGRTGPFVSINCAAIPETLIESELFGHEKGAFTGAVKAKRGKFELAEDGSIFLDEIGEMPLTLQSKLLRVLQEKAFERVGGVVTLLTNARVIAATNQDLKEGIREKRFREDLYYRLSVFPIQLPPLRDRPGALPVLSRYLVGRIASRIGKRAPEIGEAAMRAIEAYSWPGNVRELHNVLERAVILHHEGELTIPVLTPSPGAGESPRSDQPEDLDLASLERSAIEKALKRTRGHRAKASEMLGIPLRTLYHKLKRYGIG